MSSTRPSEAFQTHPLPRAHGWPSLGIGIGFAGWRREQRWRSRQRRRWRAVLGEGEIGVPAVSAAGDRLDDLVQLLVANQVAQVEDALVQATGTDDPVFPGVAQYFFSAADLPGNRKQQLQGAAIGVTDRQALFLPAGVLNEQQVLLRAELGTPGALVDSQMMALHSGFLQTSVSPMRRAVPVPSFLL